MIEPQQDEALNDYYDIAELLNDDINIISFLIMMQVSTPSSAIVKNLQSLKLTKYAEPLDKILDLKIDTLKDLQKLFISDDVSLKA